MFYQKNKSGKEGEDLAVLFLKNKGYKIIETNYKISGVEIDIIAEKEDTISFIEVKTRKSDDYGFPEEYVNRAKKRRIIRGAKLFFSNNKYGKYLDYDISMDVISITYGTEKHDIEFIEGAYEE